MKRLIPIFCLLYFLLSFEVKAQTAADYSFSASNGAYISLPASANLIAFAPGSRVKPVPLGFNFNFAGTTYTTAYVCSDGFLSFNPAARLEQYNNLSGNFILPGNPSTSHPILAPLWDQLDGGTPTSKAAFETTGPIGSRVFTFEWENWEWDALINVPVISFQVKLYEGTNKIEFIYRQEANAPYAPSASIGIAGAPSGPGNFLSLINTSSNPGVSFTTETNTLSTRPATGQVYTFLPPPVYPVDVRITSLNAPEASGCFGPNKQVKFVLKNNGTNPLNFANTPVTVQGRVRGTNSVNFPAVVVTTGTLAPGTSQEVIVSSSYNMSNAGTYHFNAAASVTGDGNQANDSLNVAVTRQVPPNIALPQNLNFTGFNAFNLTTIYPGWFEASGNKGQSPNSGWGSSQNLGGAGNTTASFHFSGSTNTHNWIISPKFISTAGTVLRFRAAITDYNNNNPAFPNMVGTDDSVRVMVSTDCGQSFNQLFSFNSTNASQLSNALTDHQINLASYAGQSIIIGFYVTQGTILNNLLYAFHLDDLFIGTPPTTDLGVIALQNPISKACFSGAENVVVTLKNYGANPLNFAISPAQVQVKVAGPGAPVILSATLSSGTLAPWATQNVTVAPSLNMLPAGVYNFSASASVAGDNTAGNDSIKAVRQTNAVLPIPQSSGFNGFVAGGGNTNLPTIFPGWYDATGPNTPGLRVTGWHSKSHLGNQGNASAAISLTSNFRNEWLVSPKLIPTASTVFQFKAAITEASGINPASFPGMTNTDNKVQVMVSTDCGNSFTPIYTFDASNSNGLTNIWSTFTFPLGQYAGQPTIVAIFATDGLVNNPNDFDFNVDDIFIGTPPPVDLGVSAMVTPQTTGCFTNAEPIKVTIQNFHSSPIDFSLSNATVTVKVSGAASSTLSAVLNSGTLASGASQTVTLSPVLNMLAAGTYNYKAYTAVAGDNVPTNDTLTATRIRYPIVSGSPALDFTGYTGTNLSTVFPDWREAYGQRPVVAPAPYWGAATGLGAPGNVTAELYLHDTWQRDWLIGPTFTATASSRLVFDAALTDWGNLNPDPLGMVNTDDSVQVLVSTDCGTTYTQIHSFNATTVGSLTNVLTPFSFPLGAYAGQKIQIAFFGTGGLVNDAAAYGFHLDNIAVNSLTGTRETIAAARPLYIFPNPSNGTFEVKLEGKPQPAILTIRTLTGQVLRKEKVNAGLNEPVKITASGLAPGVYLLEAQTGEGVQVARLIVQ